MADPLCMETMNGLVISERKNTQVITEQHSEKDQKDFPQLLKLTHRIVTSSAAKHSVDRIMFNVVSTTADLSKMCGCLSRELRAKRRSLFLPATTARYYVGSRLVILIHGG